MTKAIPSAVLIASLLLAAGCAHHAPQRGTSDWMKAVNSIKPGTAMSRVKDALGPPDKKLTGETPLRPYPPIGSPEGVLGTLPADTKYQEWIYRRGDSRYHIFFTHPLDDSSPWQVVSVRSAPAAAVY
jgi:hypothetical protein